MVEFGTFDPSAMVMQRAANFHEVQEFLNSLNREQLGTLEMLLFSACADGGHLVAAAHHGMVKQILQMKFNVCTCGMEHESAEDLLTGQPVTEQPTATVPPSESLLLPKRKGATELLEEYNLEVRPGDGAIVCKSCGLWYASLQDRMLKGPDDCHGCHLKSAQG
jgi:hypothetical protein